MRQILRHPSTAIISLLGASVAFDMAVDGYLTKMTRAIASLTADAWRADPVTFTFLGFAWAFGFMGVVLTFTSFAIVCDERMERRFTPAAAMAFCGVAVGGMSALLFHAFA